MPYYIQHPVRFYILTDLSSIFNRLYRNKDSQHRQVVHLYGIRYNAAVAGVSSAFSLDRHALARRMKVCLRPCLIWRERWSCCKNTARHIVVDLLTFAANTTGAVLHQWSAIIWRQGMEHQAPTTRPRCRSTFTRIAQGVSLAALR